MKVTNIHAITQADSSSDENYHDGRPCFSPDGKTVLFERVGSTISLQEFWSVDIDTNSETLYYKSDTYACSRASWSWNPQAMQNQIVFTGVFPKDDLPMGRIMLLSDYSPNNTALRLPVIGYQNAELYYPTWYADENILLVTDYSNQQPKLLKIDIDTLHPEVVTYDGFWSGMGTVNPVNTDIIAYAGQPITSKGYNQQYNKVYLQNGNNEPILFSETIPGVNGRAPWFSNDGLVMAFESQSETTNLQIFLKSVDLENPNTPIIPVSDPEFPAQHAKFSPDGSKLVWAQNYNSKKSQIFMGTIEY
ncbi:PD40 domain-containing protein [Kordia algicida OT-1]|uniref:Uncharacterized protein n=1 Tax=Kordia algicida OT-1 TaxID=391587 RepID=A9DNI9_9FLAO|nr:PD40 domain-containing protein [Kordia algicida]EDP97202.1 hypothetical protein KAOT1_18607 [Kordia algicida OT-1]